MAFYNNAILAEVGRHARFFNFDGQQVRSWNTHRRGEELRLVTGWTWMSRDGKQTRTGFKTISAAMRDAYYVLVQHREQPADVRKPKEIKPAPAKPRQRKAEADTPPPLKLVAGGRS